MEIPVFVQDGVFTPDGLKVKAWMEAQFVEADQNNDLGKLNGLSGYLSSYYLMAFKGKGKGFGMSPEAWFEENRLGGASAALRDMLYFEEQAAERAAQVAAVAENAQTTSTLAEKIEGLMAALAEANARIASLETPAAVVEAEAEPEKLAKRAKKQAAVVEAEVEAPDTEEPAAEAPAAEQDAEDDEDEDADAKPDGETEDAPEGDEDAAAKS